MSRLTWNAPGTHTFETGVDRMVLYSVDGMGVAWNGVTGVTESVESASVTPLYLDGIKILEARLYGDFKATIEAYSAPFEFGAHDGTAFDIQGIGYGLQPIKPFNFSFRTLIGNDIDREDSGAYKLHVVFNAYASPSDRQHQTIGSSVDPISFSWDITTVPSRISGRRPTAHLVIDSRNTDPALLSAIEDHLYGGEGVIGQLTTMQEFLDYIDAFLEIEFYEEQDNSGIFTSAMYRAYKSATVPVLAVGEETFWVDTSTSGDPDAGFLNYVIGD